MMVVRPATQSDHSDILALAKEAGIGMTSLPPDADVLFQKIERSEQSFAGAPETPKGERFLFVLEDTDVKKLVGTSGIATHVGLNRPFYSYKLSTIVQASKELNIYSRQRVLHMVNDYTGATEIGSLFLLPDYRQDGIGKFLSRSRFLMLAEFPDMFSQTVISEIRGMQDARGNSPFYTHLAQHFFQMEFQKADYINATQGGQFISDLMPKYPIYVSMLDAQAQAAIGQPLEASLPAMKMLIREGFAHQGYIDIFDAGPTLQAQRDHIRTVRKSVSARVSAIKELGAATTHMITNTQLSQFRMVFSTLEAMEEGVAISQETADALGVSVGDTIRYGLA